MSHGRQSCPSKLQQKTGCVHDTVVTETVTNILEEPGRISLVVEGGLKGIVSLVLVRTASLATWPGLSSFPLFYQCDMKRGPYTSMSRRSFTELQEMRGNL